MTGRRPLKRRLLQFSLRTFLILLTACCIWLGLKVEKVRTQRQVVRMVKKYGGQTAYAYQYPFDRASPDPPPGPKCLRVLLGDDYFADLVAVQVLSVADNDVQMIAAVATLRHLSVSGGITDLSLQSISRLTDLETLEIDGARFSADGLDLLGKLSNLRNLTLSEQSLSQGHAASIARLAQLESLSLHGSRIGSKPIEALKDMRGLTSLDLSGTLVGDEGLKALYGLKRVQSIRLEGTMVTASGIDDLQAALPQAQISRSIVGRGIY